MESRCNSEIVSLETTCATISSKAISDIFNDNSECELLCITIPLTNQTLNSEDQNKEAESEDISAIVERLDDNLMEDKSIQIESLLQRTIRSRYNSFLGRHLHLSEWM